MKPDSHPERVDAEALATHIGRVAGPCADDYADAIRALARERDEALEVLAGIVGRWRHCLQTEKLDVAIREAETLLARHKKEAAR